MNPHDETPMVMVSRGYLHKIKSELRAAKSVIIDCIATHENITNDCTYFAIKETMHQFDSLDLRKEWAKLCDKLIKIYAGEIDENN